MTNGKIDKLWDNSENGNPNFSIILVNGQQLYVREKITANIGDTVSYEEINHKTSAKGNPYVNVKNVKVDNQSNGQTPIPQARFGGKSDTERKDMFVTGIVGRSMGSGHFSIDEINKLTQNAVRAFNEFVK